MPSDAFQTDKKKVPFALYVFHLEITELAQDAEGKLLKESETKETVAESA